MHYAYYMYTGV